MAPHKRRLFSSPVLGTLLTVSEDFAGFTVGFASESVVFFVFSDLFRVSGVCVVVGASGVVEASRVAGISGVVDVSGVVGPRQRRRRSLRGNRR